MTIISKVSIFLIVILLAVGISLLVPEIREAIIELTFAGKLQIGGEDPQVIYVYVESEAFGFQEAGDPGDGSKKPVQRPPADGIQQFDFKATVYDINGNCNDAATFYICDNNTLPADCNENAPGVVTLVDNTPDQYTADGCTNCYCNYTVTWNGLQYHKKCGSWYVNVTASDTTNRYGSTVKWWQDALRQYIFYPWLSQGSQDTELDFGLITLDQWNDGKPTAGSTIKNGGNVDMTDIEWNATDFSGPDTIVVDLCSNVLGCTFINPTDTTFAVDDDTTRDGSGFIDATPTVRITYPAYGVDRCPTYACPVNPQGAKYSLYWHIYIPGGKPAGEYINEIELKSSTTEMCD